jgi:hypothetical protein
MDTDLKGFLPEKCTYQEVSSRPWDKFDFTLGSVSIRVRPGSSAGGMRLSPDIYEPIETPAPCSSRREEALTFRRLWQQQKLEPPHVGSYSAYEMSA